MQLLVLLVGIHAYLPSIIINVKIDLQFTGTKIRAIRLRDKVALKRVNTA